MAIAAVLFCCCLICDVIKQYQSKDDIVGLNKQFQRALVGDAKRRNAIHVRVHATLVFNWSKSQVMHYHSACVCTLNIEPALQHLRTKQAKANQHFFSCRES
jgi:hypothetical protein